MSEENKNNEQEPAEEVFDISDEKKTSAAVEEEASEPAEDFKNQYLYLRAEFDNYKKNMIKERSDLIKYGSERLMVEVLNVLDVFDTALQEEPTADTLNSYVKGITLTSDELKSVLKKFGLQEADSKGKKFDPNIHEALSSFETAEIEDGYIYEVFKKGYKLNGKVIRPAQVVVALAPKKASTEEPPAADDTLKETEDQ